MRARRTDTFRIHGIAISFLAGFALCYLTGIGLAVHLLYQVDSSYPTEYYVERAGLWWMTMLYAKDTIDENKRRARLSWCDRVR